MLFVNLATIILSQWFPPRQDRLLQGSVDVNDVVECRENGWIVHDSRLCKLGL